MAKMPMRVVPRPEKHTRYVAHSQGPGSQIGGGGGHGEQTYVCGRCREIMWKSMAPDDTLISVEDDEENFIAVIRVRDIVARCKGCGAYNEMP